MAQGSDPGAGTHTTTSSQGGDGVATSRDPARRGSRARLATGALLVGTVALVAAACQPVTTAAPTPPQPVSQYCAAAPPVTAADYQADFNALRTTYTEWASADGAIPVGLPDGRTVWMFGDTYAGKVDSGGAIDAADPLLHNSFVVQSGACFAPLMGGAPLARQELIPNPASDEWYWPASGVVVDNTLQVFVWVMQAAPEPLYFTNVGFDVATFALPSLQLQGVQPLPFPFNANVPYGGTALTSGGDVYLYGSNNTQNVYVARAPLGEILAAPSQWQFWSGTADPAQLADPANWVSDPAAAQPTTWVNTPARFPPGPPDLPDEAPASRPWVLPYGNGEFLATAKTVDALSSDVSVFSAPDPWGPFTYVDQVASTPPYDPPTDPDVDAYGAFSLNPTSSNPMVVFSTNVNPFVTPQPGHTIQNYGPNFVAPTAGSLPPVP